jgi:hypothetical protein
VSVPAPGWFTGTSHLLHAKSDRASVSPLMAKQVPHPGLSFELILLSSGLVARVGA